MEVLKTGTKAIYIPIPITGYLYQADQTAAGVSSLHPIRAGETCRLGLDLRLQEVKQALLELQSDVAFKAPHDQRTSYRADVAQVKRVNWYPQY